MKISHKYNDTIHYVEFDQKNIISKEISEKEFEGNGVYVNNGATFGSPAYSEYEKGSYYNCIYEISYVICTICGKEIEISRKLLRKNLVKTL